MDFDGKKGFKEDEENFLKLLKENREKHSLPLIVVCNKIDDVEDEKLSKHVKKAQSKVEKILGINTSIPTFIPVSAIQAYVYRAGAQLTVYQFEDFDKDMMVRCIHTLSGICLTMPTLSRPLALHTL
jgi:GTPase Era involved in 16S rRNA processing